MGYYIQFAGVTTNLKVPSLTFDRVVMDILPEPRGLALLGYQRYFTTNFNGVKSSIYRNMAGKDKKENLPSIKMNGVPFVIDTDSILPNKRVVLELSFDGQATTSESALFADLGGLTDNMNARLYDLKFYLDNRIIAHYNPEYKTIQDLSGNNNHATMNGGTFVEDKTITGKVIDAGSITLTNDVVLKSRLPSITKISSAATNAFGEVCVSVDGVKISSLGATVLGKGEVMARPAKTQSGSARLSTISTLDVNTAKLIQNEATFSSELHLQAEGNVIQLASVSFSVESNVLSNPSKIHDGSSLFLAAVQSVADSNAKTSLQSDFISSGSLTIESTKINDGEAVMGVKLLSTNPVVSKIKSSGVNGMVVQTKLLSSSVPPNSKVIYSDLTVCKGVVSELSVRTGLHSNLGIKRYTDTELKV